MLLLPLLLLPLLLLLVLAGLPVFLSAMHALGAAFLHLSSSGGGSVGGSCRCCCWFLLRLSPLPLLFCQTAIIHVSCSLQRHSNKSV